MDKKKLMIGAVAAATLALSGGTAYAAQQHAVSQNPAQMQATQQQAAPQTNNTQANSNVQQGDQASPDKPGQSEKPDQAEKAESKGPDTDNIQQGGGNQVEDGQPDHPGAPETGE